MQRVVLIILAIVSISTMVYSQTSNFIPSLMTFRPAVKDMRAKALGSCEILYSNPINAGISNPAKLTGCKPGFTFSFGHGREGGNESVNLKGPFNSLHYLLTIFSTVNRDSPSQINFFSAAYVRNLNKQFDKVGYGVSYHRINNSIINTKMHLFKLGTSDDDYYVDFVQRIKGSLDVFSPTVAVQKGIFSLGFTYNILVPQMDYEIMYVETLDADAGEVSGDLHAKRYSETSRPGGGNFVIGMKYQDETLRIGAIYRSKMEINYKSISQSTNLSSIHSTGSTLNAMPATYGIGFSLNASKYFRFGGEFQKRLYSQVIDNMSDGNVNRFGMEIGATEGFAFRMGCFNEEILIENAFSNDPEHYSGLSLGLAFKIGLVKLDFGLELGSCNYTTEYYSDYEDKTYLLENGNFLVSAGTTVSIGF